MLFDLIIDLFVIFLFYFACFLSICFFLLVVHYSMIQYHEEIDKKMNPEDPNKKYVNEIKDG
jgi:hypothetical protein